jgi:CBS domain-containing protein
MRISGILASKGSTVSTIAPDASVSEAIDEMQRRSIGALVVSEDGRGVAGIISERDVVNRLSTDGHAVLDEPVSAVMTAEVRTCALADCVEDLMRDMTDHRIRHLPVLDNGELAGIISIGDVVKWRVTELEEEARHLTDYIVTGR